MTDRFNAFGEYRADGFRLQGATLPRTVGSPLTDGLIAGQTAQSVKTTALGTQVGGSHYVVQKIQPVEYIHGNGLGYFEGCVVKYVTRWRAKGGLGDLEKAKHYIDLLIELERRSAASGSVSK